MRDTEAPAWHRATGPQPRVPGGRDPTESELFPRARRARAARAFPRSVRPRADDYAQVTRNVSADASTASAVTWTAFSNEIAACTAAPTFARGTSIGPPAATPSGFGAAARARLGAALRRALFFAGDFFFAAFFFFAAAFFARCFLVFRFAFAFFFAMSMLARYRGRSPRSRINRRRSASTWEGTGTRRRSAPAEAGAAVLLHRAIDTLLPSRSAAPGIVLRHGRTHERFTAFGALSIPWLPSPLNGSSRWRVAARLFLLRDRTYPTTS